jgi:hypothetical protein
MKSCSKNTVGVLHAITLGTRETENINKITLIKQILSLADCKKGQTGFGDL